MAILTKDLLFAVSIRNTVQRLGFGALIVKTPEALDDAVVTETPVLTIVDLATVGADGDWDVIQGAAERDVPVLVFGPHKDVDGFRAAKAAGVTRVVSNGQFHREMADLIERYAKRNASDATEPDPAGDFGDAEPESAGSLPFGIRGAADNAATSSDR